MGSGGSRRITCPVTSETLSITPEAGEVTLDSPRPNMPLRRAITSPLATELPMATARALGTSMGSQPSWFTTFTVCTLPGMRVRATGSVARTRAPFSTRTSPLSGRRRSRRITVCSATRRPGVYACATLDLLGVDAERAVPGPQALDALLGVGGQLEGLAPARVHDQAHRAAAHLAGHRLALAGAE